MRRWFLSLVVVVALVFPWLTSHAQGGWTPDEQAALDEVQAALEDFQMVTTYSSSMTLMQSQTIGVAYQGQSLTIEQTIDGTGTLLLERAEDGALNQSISIEETVSAQQTPGQSTTVGPMTVNMIGVDGRIYLQVEGPPEVMAIFPSGWQDVTEGSDVPGMNMFNMEAMFGQESWFIQYPEALITAATAIEILTPETVAGQKINHYRLTVDAATFLNESGGTEAYRTMFASEQMPFDLDALIERLFTDEDTTLWVDVSVGADDGLLYGYAGDFSADISAGDLITDATLSGAELDMQQTTNTSVTVYDHNKPVDIQAPVIEE
jgi:hypothetical protein